MGIKLNKTEFTDYFIKKNLLPEDGFREWLLYPGMLFNSSAKWWGSGTRNASHEGIDLCAYTDSQERIHNIAEGMKVPVLYDGVVAAVIDDFIGKSIIVKHSSADNKSEFCTIYGHTMPEDDIRIGKAVEAGDVIAKVVGIKESKSGMRPHLHISIGFPASAEISYDAIDWKDISDPNKITLIDPLQVIDRYRLV
ncbi:MAG: peptidoglycan DD-metalloendopeptidase family protein [Nitrospirae bacterium]|nr:peptidoglycan DD-metalloendopeptidase family protein [Nitrospirota bacterium]